MLTTSDRIKICHRCPRLNRGNNPFQCGADPAGAAIRDHAENDNCPNGMFLPGIKVLVGKAGTPRPIAGPNAASPRLIFARMAICAICPHSTSQNGRVVACTVCGCQLANKVRDVESTCPANPPKWGAVPLESRERWFSHTGAMGDIIYALHAIKAAGGGSLYVHHDASIRPAHYMTPRHAAALGPLVEAQPYITHFELTEDWPTATHRLDTFRDVGFFDNNLILLHHRALGLESVPKYEPWLTVPDPKRVAPVVIFRSHRYRNREGEAIWKQIHEKYPDKIFLGLPKEHADYEDRFGPVPYYPTKNLLEAAQIISGADLICGNQTSLFAIATGLGKRTVLEVDPSIPDCCFPMRSSYHIWERDGELPPLGKRTPRKTPIWHVAHKMDLKGHEDSKRNQNAQLTWHWGSAADKNWNVVWYSPDPVFTSKEIGDTRQVPYINDLLGYAFQKPDEDIIVWSNLDISLVPEAARVIRRKLETGPCCFARRVDVDNARKVLFRSDLHHMTTHGGTDLFAFRAGWWKANHQLMPRMFIACEAFDFVLRRIMLAQRPLAEITPTICYHEKHDAFWAKDENVKENPAQAHNRKLAVEWCKTNGFERALFKTGPYLLKCDGEY